MKDIFEYTPGYSDLELTEDSRVMGGRASVYEAKFWVKKMGSLMSEKKSLLEESKENHREMMMVRKPNSLRYMTRTCA